MTVDNQTKRGDFSMRQKIVILFILCGVLTLTACSKTNDTILESSSEISTATVTESALEPDAVTTPDTSTTETAAAETTDSAGADNTGSPAGTATSGATQGKTNPSAGTSSVPATVKPTEQTPSQPTPPPVTSTAPPVTDTQPPANVRTCVYNAELSNQVFQLVNDFRAENGVAKLTYNATNAGYAKAQAEYNAVNDVEDMAQHTSRQIGACGTGINTRGGASAIPTIAVTNWQNSAGHRKNMLDPQFDIGGVAVYEIRYSGVCEEYVVILDFDISTNIKSNPGIRK
jgi:uncharacterized protein YkwD